MHRSCIKITALSAAVRSRQIDTEVLETAPEPENTEKQQFLKFNSFNKALFKKTAIVYTCVKDQEKDF